MNVGDPAHGTQLPRATDDAAVPGDLGALLARLDHRIAECASAGDARRVFLVVYRTMTGAVARGVDTGRFVDPAWTASLTARFATLYFDAEEAYLAGDRCPGPWQAAFGAGAQPRVTAVEHALLGINAHIVYDLPRAVAATMRTHGDVSDGEVGPGTLARRRHDYEVVNHILAETIDDAQRTLAREAPASRLLDVVAWRLDEYAAELLLRASRTQGWHSAVALAVTRTDAEAEAVRAHLERIACGYVARIDVTRLVPTRLGRRIAARLRAPFGPVVPEVPAVEG